MKRLSIQGLLLAASAGLVGWCISSGYGQSPPQVRATLTSLRSAHQDRVEDIRASVEPANRFLENMDRLAEIEITWKDRRVLSAFELRLWEIARDRKARPKLYADIEQRYAYPARNPQRQSGVDPWRALPEDSLPESRLVWEYLLIRPRITDARGQYWKAASIILRKIDNPGSVVVALEIMAISRNTRLQEECLGLVLGYPDPETARRILDIYKQDTIGKKGIYERFLESVGENSMISQVARQRWLDAFIKLKRQKPEYADGVMDRAYEELGKPLKREFLPGFDDKPLSASK
jgi:hypothetical protein